MWSFYRLNSIRKGKIHVAFGPNVYDSIYFPCLPDWPTMNERDPHTVTKIDSIKATDLGDLCRHCLKRVKINGNVAGW